MNKNTYKTLMEKTGCEVGDIKSTDIYCRQTNTECCEIYTIINDQKISVIYKKDTK